MNLIVTKSDFFLFDAHVFLTPLLEDEAKLKPPFRFLVDPKEYDKFYMTGASMTVGDSTLRPLSASETNKNHFWKHYGLLHKHSGAFIRHLPLVYEFTEKVELVLDEPLLRVQVLAQALLWPWGWSCELKCHLDKTLHADTLSYLVRNQKSDITEPGTFVVAGERMKCNQVFKKISEKLRQHIFSDNLDDGDFVHPIPVSRHFVLSLLEIQSKAKPYEWSPDVQMQKLSDKERAELYSILLGRSVSEGDAIKYEQREPRPYLLTTFGGAAFGLSDFDNGTLLYLARPRLGGKEKGPEAIECLSANNGRCAQTALALASFLQIINISGIGNSRIKDLVDSAKGNLEQLTIDRSNHFNKGFVRNNKFVSKFLPPE